MSFPWAINIKHKSVAQLTADSRGNLDLSKQKPDSGTYNFIDSMGLIVSMKRISGEFKEVSKNISVKKSFFIDITAKCERDNSSGKLERMFMSPEVKSLRINGAFIRELFYTENTNNKAVVVLGGSTNEDLSTLLPPAVLLSSHGFNVLALAFFGEKGMNSSLAEIPLEYFEKVFVWLEKSPITNCKEIYIYGGSIGGDLALLLASRYPIITKVVAFNPLAWCFQGLTLKKVLRLQRTRKRQG